MPIMDKDDELIGESCDICGHVFKAGEFAVYGEGHAFCSHKCIRWFERVNKVKINTYVPNDIDDEGGDVL